MRDTTSVTVRNLPAEVKDRLAQRAKQTGSSLESFLRSLLTREAILTREAMAAPQQERFSDWHARAIAPSGLSDEEHAAFVRVLEAARRTPEEDEDTFADWS